MEVRVATTNTMDKVMMLSRINIHANGCSRTESNQPRYSP